MVASHHTSNPSNTASHFAIYGPWKYATHGYYQYAFGLFFGVVQAVTGANYGVKKGAMLR